ncbi:centrosomal protein of 162 kDa isoform X2 [Hippocampus comes]|uniref:centrosomal protein of 162 kDa isoform X2 n=1 Tax=Hippocampus comes TaxID=109280 RepID=UPI00094F07C4|nr:PREDICTED: centrosomal protein of 162 kDa-like isoform X2 [Hippocampus comes]
MFFFCIWRGCWTFYDFRGAQSIIMYQNQAKEKLDELFLKESVSDDSGDLHDKLSASKSSHQSQKGVTSSEGLDTLMEEEEKAMFFGELEARASSNIDYCQLNKEIDITSYTTGIHRRISEEEPDLNDNDQNKIGGSPCLTQCNKDFEDEDVAIEKFIMSPVITKDNSYKDSQGQMEGRMKEVPEVPGSQDIDLLYVQSAGSEMDALHNAYREINTGEDSDDLKLHRLSLEWNDSNNNAIALSSKRHQAAKSPECASTNESELPTAEELMRPIRPVSEHDKEELFCPLDRTFPVLTKNEEHHEQPEKVESIKLKGLKRSESSSPSIHPEHSHLGLTRRIREEVERLMQEQNICAPSTASQLGKEKKEPHPRRCTSNPPSTSSTRKPFVATPTVQKVEAKRLTRVNKTAAATKSSVSQAIKPSFKTAKNKEKDGNDTDPGLKMSSNLVVSVQSLVNVLQKQMAASSCQEVTDGTSLLEELRGQLTQKDKELQLMKQQKEELQQHNYVLQSKLHSAEEASKKLRLTEKADPTTEKTLQQIEKEIRDQEMIIQGYQQENEKLYLQLKAQRSKSAADEQAMFHENQRLESELLFTREQLSKSSCSLDHRIKDLLADLNTSQMNEAKLSEDIHRLRQENQALHLDMELIRKERDMAKAQTVSTSVTVPEDTYREEVAALKKQIQWFTDNQEVLSRRDAARLKAATAEIDRLKEQVENMKTQVGKRNSVLHSKEKRVDLKRMKELELQVKQLEQTLRSRNPNSLSALIAAAATTDTKGDVATGIKLASNDINTLLERRIQHVEAEMERHDEEAKHNLQSMEKQFQNTKLRYEHQISELEQQLKYKQEGAAISASGTESWMSQVERMKVELQQVQEAYEQKETILQDQIETLKKQVKRKALHSPTRHQRQAEEAHGARIARLNQELSLKTQTVQELTRTVERLQKERRNMLSGPNLQQDSQNKEPKRQLNTVKSALSTQEEMFPAAQCEKTYQPTVFTGSHITEVLKENDALRERLKQLELHNEQQKEALTCDVVQAKEELCRQRDHFLDQISSLKAEKFKALEHMRATHAMEHSSSKVAQLSNELNAREIMVKLLQDQLKELHGAKEALALSKTREAALEAQLSTLLKELKDAKEAQSPEVKLLCSLKAKLLTMELRQQDREKELNKIIGGSWPEGDQQSQVNHWRCLAVDKVRELEAFRLELDSILDIVRHMQRQGMNLPTPDS